MEETNAILFTFFYIYLVCSVPVWTYRFSDKIYIFSNIKNCHDDDFVEVLLILIKTPFYPIELAYNLQSFLGWFSKRTVKVAIKNYSKKFLSETKDFSGALSEVKSSKSLEVLIER